MEHGNQYYYTTMETLAFSWNMEINTTPQLWKILYLHYLGYGLLPMKGYWV